MHAIHPHDDEYHYTIRGQVRERPKGITLKDLPKVHLLRDGPFSPPEEVLLPSLMVVGPSDVPRSQEIWAMR